jgi:hypothetical protein
MLLRILSRRVGAGRCLLSMEVQIVKDHSDNLDKLSFCEHIKVKVFLEFCTFSKKDYSVTTTNTIVQNRQIQTYPNYTYPLSTLQTEAIVDRLAQAELNSLTTRHSRSNGLY